MKNSELEPPIKKNLEKIIALPSVPFSSHIFRNSSGGILFVDSSGETRKIIKDVIKMILRSFVGGTISLPIRIYEPRSFLERLADTWVHFSDHFGTASKIPSSKPLERFQTVLGGVTSGFYAAFLNQKQPFNPTLGETASVKLPCGLLCFMEQVSHHPPITRFECEDGEGRFEMWGQAHIEYKLGVKSVTGKQEGFNFLKLKDCSSSSSLSSSENKLQNQTSSSKKEGGEIYRWKVPSIKIDGLENRICYFQNTLELCSFPFPSETSSSLSVSNMSLDGSLDNSNVSYKAVVYFNPSYSQIEKTLKSFKSKDIGSLSQIKDFLCGSIFEVSNSGNNNIIKSKIVGTVYGSWLNKIFVNDNLIWELPNKERRANEKTFLEKLVRMEEYILPSDSQRRIDIIELKKGNFTKAQNNKYYIEKVQREEAKMRKNMKKV